MEEIFGIKYKPGDAPAVLLSESDHNITRGYTNTWRVQETANQGGSFSWLSVTEQQIRDLATGMFDAADVPQIVQNEYWKLFNSYLGTLR
jgi:hypothetical protein